MQDDRSWGSTSEAEIVLKMSQKIAGVYKKLPVVNFLSLKYILAEFKLHESMSYSVNIERVPLEMHHANQHVEATRMAA